MKGNKSSQVSPNARRRAQCKGGGRKENIYVCTTDCTTCRRLLVPAFTWSRNVGKRDEREHLGLNLPDGGRVRCADDILILGTDSGSDFDPVCREAAHLGHRK